MNPEIDLAFSRAFCDVTLITGTVIPTVPPPIKILFPAPSSTFGWWISYLAKPSAITYYRDIIESKDGVSTVILEKVQYPSFQVAREMRQEDFYPPEWVKLVTNENGKIQKAIVN